MTNIKRCISNYKRTIATKRDRLVVYGKLLLHKSSHDPLIMLRYIRWKAIYLHSTSTPSPPPLPQLPDLISWWLDKGSLHIKSYDTLITWSEIATWQKNDISLLPRLWYWPNLIRCWFTTRRCYKKSHMNLWWSRGHVR